MGGAPNFPKYYFVIFYCATIFELSVVRRIYNKEGKKFRAVKLPFPLAGFFFEFPLHFEEEGVLVVVEDRGTGGDVFLTVAVLVVGSGGGVAGGGRRGGRAPPLRFEAAASFLVSASALLNFVRILEKTDSPQNSLGIFSAPTNERSEMSIRRHISSGMN